MVRIIIKTTNPARKLRQARKAIGNLREPMDRIGKAIADDAGKNIDRQTLADGTRMPPSKAATKEGRKTLYKTGYLRRSFKHKSTRNSATIESGASFYGYIHKGTSKMVRRPILGVSRNGLKRIANIIASHIRRAIR